MLGTLLDLITDLKYPIKCKHCDFKTNSALAILFHIRNHDHKPTTRDFKFVLKYCLVSRIIKTIIACAIFVPLLLVKIICYPFWFIFENLL